MTSNPRLTRRQSAIIGAFTGKLAGDFEAMHEYIEEIMGRPVWTHEMGGEAFAAEIAERARPDFMNLCYGKDVENPAMILAKETGVWLAGGPITGDVASRLAASLLPGATPELVDKWYGEWMSDDQPAPPGFGFTAALIDADTAAAMMGHVCKTPDAHDHTNDAKAWCVTCGHEHITSVPKITFKCKSCGWAQWYKPQALQHEADIPGHETYEDKHEFGPYPESVTAISWEQAAELAAKKFPDLVRRNMICTDRAFEDMQKFREGQRLGYAEGLLASTTVGGN